MGIAGGSRSRRAEHLEESAQRGAGTRDISRRGLTASASREVFGDEPLVRGIVDRSLAQPSTEVLDREDILVDRAGRMTSRVQMPDVSSKNRTNRIRFNARPDGRATKNFVQQRRLPVRPTGR